MNLRLPPWSGGQPNYPTPRKEIGENVDEWFTLLTFNFTINVILHEKYIMKNAVNKRKPRKCIQKVIRSAKNVGFTHTKIQFDIIYNVVDFELRRNFRRFDDASIFNTHFTNINNCKYIWLLYANKYKFNINNQSIKLYNQYENKFQQYGQYVYQYNQYGNAFNRRGNYRPSYATNQINFGLY